MYFYEKINNKKTSGYYIFNPHSRAGLSNKTFCHVGLISVPCSVATMSHMSVEHLNVAIVTKELNFKFYLL